VAQTDLTANPFALMMTPEAVFAAIEQSERLSRLKSRICRPLDGPRPVVESTPELQAFDQAVEATQEPEPEPEPELEPEAPLEWPSIQYE
jgi:hypothetical protein